MWQHSKPRDGCWSVDLNDWPMPRLLLGSECWQMVSKEMVVDMIPAILYALLVVLGIVCSCLAFSYGLYRVQNATHCGWAILFFVGLLALAYFLSLLLNQIPVRGGP